MNEEKGNPLFLRWKDPIGNRSIY